MLEHGVRLSVKLFSTSTTVGVDEKTSSGSNSLSRGVEILSMFLEWSLNLLCDNHVQYLSQLIFPILGLLNV